MMTLPKHLKTPEAMIRLCLLLEYPRADIVDMLTEVFGLTTEAAEAKLSEFDI